MKRYVFYLSHVLLYIVLYYLNSYTINNLKELQPDSLQTQVNNINSIIVQRI